MSGGSWTASPTSSAALAGMLERFCTTLDCVDVAFIPDGILDQLPQPATASARTRVGGIDLDKARTRSVLAAVVALAAAPDGFSVADLVTKVHAITGHDTYSIRQAAYDIRKLRGHNLVTKPGAATATRSRPKRPAPSSPSSSSATRSSAPSSPVSESPAAAAPPATWTIIDRDYETLRTNMTHLFDHLALTTMAA